MWNGYLLQDTPDQHPMPINADQNQGIGSKFLSMPINTGIDQHWLSLISIYSWIKQNCYQCWSMPINADQCRSMQINAGSILLDLALVGIDRHWEELIGIDRHWSALGSSHNFDRHWSALISIGHWSRESCIKVCSISYNVEWHKGLWHSLALRRRLGF